MPITVRYDENGFDGRPVTSAAAHPDGVRLRRTPDGDVEVVDTHDAPVGVYGAGRFVSATITPPAPTDGDAAAEQDTPPEPDAPLSFTKLKAPLHSRTIEIHGPAGLGFDLFEAFIPRAAKLPTPEEQARIAQRRMSEEQAKARSEERRIADLICAVPDTFGAYSGAELTRAYERGRGDMADDLGADSPEDLDDDEDCCGGACG